METKKVGNFEVTEKDLQAFISRLPQEQQMYAQMPEFAKQCEERLVEIALFANLGEELNIEETEEYKATMAAARRDILSQMAMAAVLRDINVNDDDVKAFFEANAARYEEPAAATAKHILVESEEKANEIKAKIEAEELSFEDAAKEHSTCPSKEQGGSLGTFRPGQMVPEFDQAVFGGNVNELIGPVQTQFGYHLIFVEDRTEAKQSEFEDVKPKVMQDAIMDKQNTVYTEKAEELKAKYL